jgi:hypothetical protein
MDSNSDSITSSKISKMHDKIVDSTYGSKINNFDNTQNERILVPGMSYTETLCVFAAGRIDYKIC